MKSKHHSVPNPLLGLSRLLVRGLCPGILAFAPASWAETATFNTPGTIDWEVPENVSTVTIECRGGGGAGGSAVTTGSNCRGGGGAGGSYARTANLSVIPGTIYKVTVGAGGSSIASSTNGSVLSEQTGGISKFSSLDLATNYALAVGGVGGTNAVSGAVSNQPGGAGASTGSIGDV